MLRTTVIKFNVTVIFLFVTAMFFWALSVPAPEAQNKLNFETQVKNGSSAWTTGRYPRANGSNAFVQSSVAAGGAGSCTNQFVRATTDNAAPTCATVGTADISSAILTDTMTVTRDFPLQCTHPRVKSLAGNAYFDVEALSTGDYDQMVAKFTSGVEGRITCTGFVPNELAGTPAAKIIFDVQPHVACSASQFFGVNIRYRFWGSGSADTALTSETLQDISGSTTAHSLTHATFPASGSLSAPNAGDNIVLEIIRNTPSGTNCAQIMEVIPGSAKLRVDVKVKN